MQQFFIIFFFHKANEKFLHTAFFYIKKLLHTATFYTKRKLRKNIFHKKAFRQMDLYTENFLQRSSLPTKALIRRIFQMLVYINHFPILLCTTQLILNISQYYFVLQNFTQNTSWCYFRQYGQMERQRYISKSKVSKIGGFEPFLTFRCRKSHWLT